MYLNTYSPLFFNPKFVQLGKKQREEERDRKKERERVIESESDRESER